MYLGALSGPNCKGISAFSQLASAERWSQELVDTLWRVAGHEGPPPVLPASMQGKKTFFRSSAPGLMTTLLSKAAEKKMTPEQRASLGLVAGTPEEKKFLLFWSQTMVAPCEKTNWLEKVVGGAFQVVGTFVPVVALAKGAIDYKQGMDAAKTAEKFAVAADEIMTTAYAAQDARDAAVFDSQMSALRAFSPISTAQPLALKSTPAPRSSTLSNVVIFGSIAAGVLLLGALRK